MPAQIAKPAIPASAPEARVAAMITRVIGSPCACPIRGLASAIRVRKPKRLTESAHHPAMRSTRASGRAQVKFCQPSSASCSEASKSCEFGKLLCGSRHVP